METLQDVLDKTNKLYPWEKFETRDVRNEILRELFYINQNQKEWNKILIRESDLDLKEIIDKYLIQPQ